MSTSIYVVTIHDNTPCEGFAASKVFATWSQAYRDVCEEIKDFQDEWTVFEKVENSGIYLCISMRNRDAEDHDTLELTIQQQQLTFFRTCSECDSPMNEGYCIEDGLEYYCSDDCLHKHISQEEYQKLYNEGNGSSYWTDWEEE